MNQFDLLVISDILDFTEENSMGGILFSADFEKAFDSIEHPFYLLYLNSLGLVPNLFTGSEHSKMQKAV